MNKPKLFSYFDPEYFALEQKSLFARSPHYIGHELLVPYPNDYKVIEWMNNSHFMINNEGKLHLISNICKHRQATMLHSRGNTNLIICPLHNWSYKTTGEFNFAPLFNSQPNCTNLDKEELINWKGILFRPTRDIIADLKNSNLSKYIDFTNYQYSNTVITEYAFNWKTFMEVYTEDYHVEAFHPGLGSFVDCKHLKWEFGDWYNVQAVAAKEHLSQHGSKLYAQWQQKILQLSHGSLPKLGALWLTYYPNIMIKCYPKCIVIAIVIPISSERTKVVTEFYYPDEILSFDSEFVELHQQVYFETAKEDDEICYQLHNGRKSLYLAGKEEDGPYQIPLESGLQHFHEFLVRETY
jgi:choline monooxygenase